MPIKDTTTKFRFSYGDLLQHAFEKTTFLHRDASILAQRGVTNKDLEDFDNLIHSFIETKEDIAFTGQITDVAQTRDIKRKEVEIMGRDILGIAETVYKGQSGVYKSFGFVNLSRLSDGDFIMAANTLYDKATQYLSELTAKGLTPAMLLEFRKMIDELPPLVNNLASIKSERDINTEIRRNAANKLYETMADLCLIAVNYFKDRDAAKYSDYVIYRKGPTSQTRKGIVKPKTTISRNLKGVRADTLFKIKNEGQGELDFYFSTTEAGNPVTLFKTVPAYQEHSHSATELGYDGQTGAIKFNIRNTSETVNSHYSLKIN